MATCKIQDEQRQRILPLKGLIMDVDGVLTDGKIIMNNRGEESKNFHVRDGHGIKLLKRAGFHLALLTGRQSQVVEFRAKELGINTIFQKVRNKISVYEQIKSKFSLVDEQICYVGDDLVDIPVLKKVGFAATVADGIPELDDIIHWRSRYPGGGGAIRELCEIILRVQGSWNRLTQRYFG